MTDKLSVHEAIAKVIGELPAIGKDSYNQQQGFAFRGIDAVVSALKPLLAKHGVVIVPDVTERLYAQRATARGGIMHEVNLHVRFHVYGPDGSSVEASGWGEGTDSGDKATNKAMTGAYKYVLFQLFAIADEAADADATSPEATVHKDATPAPEIWKELGYESIENLADVVEKLKAKWQLITDDVARAELKQWLADRGYDKRWPVKSSDLAIYTEVLNGAAPKAAVPKTSEIDVPSLETIAQLFKDMEVTEAEYAPRCAVLVGHPVSQMRDLTFEDGVLVIDTLRSLMETAAR